MRLLVSLIARLASKRGLIVLLVLYAAVFGAILITIGQISAVSGGNGILDFEPGYDATRIEAVFASYGAQGMGLYARIQWLDIVNPALYSLIACAFTYLLWRGRGPDWLCLLPLLGGIGDYAENVTLFLLSRSFPEVPLGLAALSSGLSWAKLGLLALGLLPLIAGLLRLAMARWHTRQS